MKGYVDDIVGIHAFFLPFPPPASRNRLGSEEEKDLGDIWRGTRSSGLFISCKD